MTVKLGNSWKMHARSMGISQNVIQEHLNNRDIEMKTLKKVTRGSKITKVKAKNPILIVGAGPSWKDNIEQIKSFQGITMSVDILIKEFDKLEFLPDYFMSVEAHFKAQKLWPIGFMDFFWGRKGNGKMPTWVFSSWSTGKTKQWVAQNKCKTIDWITDDELRIGNVGLFAIMYAYKVLKADKIMLVGFEHSGDKKDKQPYREWQADFWYFVRTWPKGVIVNCTDAGALYDDDYILDSTLDSLVIE